MRIQTMKQYQRAVSRGTPATYRFLAAALATAALAAPSSAADDDDKGIVRPVVKHVVKFVLGKLVDDNIWDAVTGAPDLVKVDQRLRQLEDCAALRPEMLDEIHKLRQQLNDRVTRDEFRRMADRTTEQLGVIQQRLDEHDEEIEKLKVLQEDLKNKTENSASAEYFRRRGEAYEADSKKHQGYEADSRKYKAAACYNIAIQLAPKDPAGYLRRSEFYVKLGAAGVAVADAAEVIRLDPKSAAARYFQGLGNLANGSYQEAVEDLNRALELGAPDSAAAYAARGAARFHRGEYELALGDCNDSIRTNPNPLAYRVAAMTLAARKDFDNAAAWASQAVSLAPSADNLLVLAEARISRREFDQAVEDAGKAVRLAPKSARGYYLRGLGYAGGTKYAEAVKEYTEAIKLDPLFAAAYNARAYAYSNGTTRDTNQAIADATEALRLDPKFVDAYCTLGVAYRLRADDTPVLAFDPEPVRKAAQQAKELDYDRAIAQLSIAIRLDPQCAKAYLWRGDAYFLRNKPGDREQHTADYKEAERLSGKP
jgi:tetratricopeptide (TPR) repeat protein